MIVMVTYPGGGSGIQESNGEKPMVLMKTEWIPIQYQLKCIKPDAGYVHHLWEGIFYILHQVISTN